MVSVLRWFRGEGRDATLIGWSWVGLVDQVPGATATKIHMLPVLMNRFNDDLHGEPTVVAVMANEALVHILVDHLQAIISGAIDFIAAGITEDLLRNQTLVIESETALKAFTPGTFLLASQRASTAALEMDR